MGTLTNIAALVARSGHSVDVERAISTEDAAGGRRTTWNTVRQAVPAWVQPAKAETIETYGKRNMRVTHSVYFASDPGLCPGDRLRFSRRFLVVGGVSNAGELDRLWRADCREQ
ncbi:MAG: head-tail adaptor protein [Planctomycetes bacterium]|nr:head-tail adaptor protein [Planctomycetota bacterium]